MQLNKKVSPLLLMGGKYTQRFEMAKTQTDYVRTEDYLQSVFIYL